MKLNPDRRVAIGMTLLMVFALANLRLLRKAVEYYRSPPSPWNTLADAEVFQRLRSLIPADEVVGVIWNRGDPETLYITFPATRHEFAPVRTVPGTSTNWVVARDITDDSRLRVSHELVEELAGGVNLYRKRRAP